MFFSVSIEKYKLLQHSQIYLVFGFSLEAFVNLIDILISKLRIFITFPFLIKLYIQIDSDITSNQKASKASYNCS